MRQPWRPCTREAPERWAGRSLGAAEVSLAAYGGAGTAVLHAALHAGPLALAAMALVREPCAFAHAATARRHRLPWQAQMHGVLKEYDLPDLLTSLARTGPAVLVLRPLGASGKPLPRSRALQAYRPALRQFSASRRLLRVLAGPLIRPHAEAEVVAAFLAGAGLHRRPERLSITA